MSFILCFHFQGIFLLARFAGIMTAMYFYNALLEDFEEVDQEDKEYIPLLESPWRMAYASAEVRLTS